MADLATPEQLAVVRGVTFDPDDSLAALVLDGASAEVRTYCNQRFDLVSNEEIWVDGTGTNALLLPELPVNAVSSLKFLEADASETAYLPADFRIGNSGILWRTNTWDTWPYGHRNIHVKYSHGYLTIPADLVLVTLQIAARMYTLSTSAGRAVTAESIGTYSVTYADPLATTELLGVEKAVLDRYRQSRVA